MWESFAKSVEARMVEANLPGLVIRATRNRKLLFSIGRGHTWLPDGPPPDDRTLFCVSSLTKTATAALVLQLRDDGHLDLDEAITSYLPELKETALFVRGEVPTVHHFLCHLAGIPMGDYNVYELDRSRLVEELDGVRCVYPPGSQFKYSNLGYVILGAMVARLRQRSYHDCVSDLIASRLDLNGIVPSHLLDNRRALAAGHQRGHHRSLVHADDTLVPAPCFRGAVAASHLYADAQSVIGLLEGILLDDVTSSGLLTARARREMTTPHTAAELAGKHRYGLGVHISDCVGHRCFQHAGGGPGYTSLSAVLPDSRLAVAILTNRCSAFPEVYGILEQLVETAVGGDSSKRQRETTVPLDALCGRYSSDKGRLEIRREGRRLRGELNGVEIPLTPRNWNAFVPEAGPFRDSLLRFHIEKSAVFGCSAGDLWFERGDALAAKKWNAEWEPLNGRYHAEGYGDALVYQRNGQLIFAVNPFVEVRLKSTHNTRRFTQRNGPFAGEALHFRADKSGSIRAIEIGTMRFKRTERL